MRVSRNRERAAREHLLCDQVLGVMDSTGNSLAPVIDSLTEGLAKVIQAAEELASPAPLKARVCHTFAELQETKGHLEILLSVVRQRRRQLSSFRERTEHLAEYRLELNPIDVPFNSDAPQPHQQMAASIAALSVGPAPADRPHRRTETSDSSTADHQRDHTLPNGAPDDREREEESLV